MPGAYLDKTNLPSVILVHTRVTILRKNSSICICLKFITNWSQRIDCKPYNPILEMPMKTHIFDVGQSRKYIQSNLLRGTLCLAMPSLLRQHHTSAKPVLGL